ncbi:MAG: Lytic transglycosylase, catalytic [Myxococcaceae bacterium]|nr:Lytic transglycosylase, catalytic [Myxococcaceae bacterium]
MKVSNDDRLHGKHSRWVVPRQRARLAPGTSSSPGRRERGEAAAVGNLQGCPRACVQLVCAQARQLLRARGRHCAAPALALLSCCLWLAAFSAPVHAQAVAPTSRHSAARRVEVAVLRSSVHEASRVYRVPVALILAVIRAESNFDPLAVSGARAQGLMQMLSRTSAEMGVLDAFDARQNILGGTRYLRVLSDRWHGDLVLTIASYNAGPAAVAKYGGIPPFKETRRYVRRVLSYLIAYQRVLRNESLTSGLVGLRSG